MRMDAGNELEYWNVGIADFAGLLRRSTFRYCGRIAAQATTAELECWGFVSKTHYSIIPLFHYSEFACRPAITQPTTAALSDHAALFLGQERLGFKFQEAITDT